MLPIPVLFLVLLSLFSAPPLQAQTVRGTLTEEETGMPLGGALVVLLDAQGRQQTATLTNEAGHFTIQAPQPGVYRLRAERIGYRSTYSSRFQLRAGQTFEYSLVAPHEAVRLAGIEVRGQQRCVIRPQEGLQTHALWEEARKALNVTSVVQDERIQGMTLLQYERELDPTTLRGSTERSWYRSGFSKRPFVSRSAEELARTGYVHRTDEDTRYFAPDADVLLSDLFLDHHCMRIRSGGRDRPGLIGLAFEPVRSRDLPGIRGVLWLDEKTAELRYMEYGYTGLPFSLSADRLGGQVEFRRLPTGAWIVQRWWIRMPVTGPEAWERPGDPFFAARRQAAIIRIKEEGGEVMEIFTTGGVTALSERAFFNGVVFDSTRAAPLAGATVFLSGTHHAATTDEQGRFFLDDLSAGAYSVSFLHPRLDSLGYVPAVQEVAVRGGEVTELELAVPPLPTVLASVCAGGSFDFGPATLLGVVRDAQTGMAIAGAQVVLSWSNQSVESDPGAGGIRGEGERGVTGERWNEVTILTDQRGQYRVCGIPADRQVRVHVRWGMQVSDRAELRLRGGEPVLYDLEVVTTETLGSRQ